MRSWLLICAVALLTPNPLWAHALGAECSLKDGTVHVEAFFDDDSPAVNARVEVLDGQAKVIANGKTDAMGFWSFPAPAVGKYLVIVDAGAGHRTRVSITVPGAKTAPELATAPTSNNKATISDGSTKEEFTGFPYLKVGLGVGGIFLFSLAFLVARRKSRGDPLI